MNALRCTIDILADHAEICWLISISSADASNAALLFSALRSGMIPEVHFRDPRVREIFLIRMDTAVLGDLTISIPTNWSEALLHLFLNTALNGWTDTAHLDKAFHCTGKDITITITVTP